MVKDNDTEESIDALKDITHNEINEIFLRLSNDKPLTTDELTRVSTEIIMNKEEMDGE